jgi:hypothetical protein
MNPASRFLSELGSRVPTLTSAVRPVGQLEEEAAMLSTSDRTDQPSVTHEEWRSIPDWPEYEASSLGRVRGVDRVAVTRRGFSRNIPGRVRALSVNPKNGYLQVVLYRRELMRWTTVHALITETFLGPRPDGMVVRHLDGMPLNCAIDNLTYGTHAENSQDMIRHGRCPGLSRTLCLLEHRLAPPNLSPCDLRRGRRRCLSCKRACDYCKRHPDLDWREVSHRYYIEIMGSSASLELITAQSGGSR